MVPTLPNQAAESSLETTLPVVEVEATTPAVEVCNNVHMGCPVVAWANEEANKSMEVFE